MSNRQYTPEDITSSMQTAGIDYALLIANSDPLNNSGLRTKEVIKISEKHTKLKAIGAIETDTFGEEQINTLIRYLNTRKIFGVKFYPGYDGYYPDDTRFTKIYEFCQQNGNPVIFHTGLLEEGYEGDINQAHPKHIEPVAISYPNLKIVIAHIGNPWVKDCARVVKNYLHVYTDISALVPHDYAVLSASDGRKIKKLLEEYQLLAGDFKKCLFGTDYPIDPQKEYIDTINTIEMTHNEKELMFWRNANEIFGLDI